MADEFEVTIYKQVFFVPIGREVWEDNLAIALDEGWIALLPGVRFEDAWDLWRADKQYAVVLDYLAGSPAV